MAYGDLKDLFRIIASDKILRSRPFSIVKNPKYDGSQRGLTSMVYKVFDKKSSCANISGSAIKSEIMYQTKTYQKNCKSQLLENLRNEKYTHHLKIIFEVMILQICKK